MRAFLLRSIGANPWTSAQDAILAISVLATGLLLAIEFDLFQFANDLSSAERKISVTEAIALTFLLALCIAAFVYRRYHDEQIEAKSRAETEAVMRDLRDQALHDVLTGLPNRRAVMAHLKELSLQGDEQQSAFFLLDLNGFKSINDRYGHTAGDHVLQVIAERFKRVARPSDLLARLGGDEFAIISYDIDYPGAVAVGHRYLATLENKIWVEGVGHHIGVSAGGVLIPQDCKKVEDIITCADFAMYRAKESDRSTLVLYADVGQRPANFGARQQPR